MLPLNWASKSPHMVRDVFLFKHLAFKQKPPAFVLFDFMIFFHFDVFSLIKLIYIQVYGII